MINWTDLGDDRWMATIEGTGHTLYAGQNGDGSFYWSFNGKGKCSAPMFNYDGIGNPARHVAAAIENCKREAEAAYMAAIA